MDGFDRLLELQLRRKLDPIVNSPVPPRRGRAGWRRPGNQAQVGAPIKPIGCVP